MLDAHQTDHDAAHTLLDRRLHVQCRALADVPHRFRAVSSWLNYNSVLVPQVQDGEEYDLLVEDMNKARIALDEVMVYFDPNADLPEYDVQAVSWFRACVQQTPTQGRAFPEFASLLHRAQEASVNNRGLVLEIHRDIARHVVYRLGPEVNTLLEVLDHELQRLEEARAEWTEKMRNHADHAIADIQSVSKVVRLISLNASVEAARAGEAGRAFGVIASEVKAMSEAIQASAGTVTKAVKDLTSRL